VIKAVGCYRQSSKWDPVLDYVMITEKEAATYLDKNVKYVFLPLAMQNKIIVSLQDLLCFEINRR
jgi:hypothetical protein